MSDRSMQVDTAPMMLDVDVGNSRLKWRLRSGMDVLQRGSVGHEALSYFAEPLPWRRLAQVNVASVAKPEVVERVRQEAASAGCARLFVARTGARFGRLTNAYAEPGMLGVDRWLAMIAAFDLVEGAVCVVDCGTALTLDFIDAMGRHEGGYILPGFELQRRALHLGTHAVKVPAGRLPELVPGMSTADCVLHGVYAFLRHGLEGVLRERLQARPYRIIYTGGDAPHLRNEIELPSDLRPDLVLDGLQLLADAER